ncbi:MAG: phage tail protein [Myxococcota bacterium]
MWTPKFEGTNRHDGRKANVRFDNLDPKNLIMSMGPRLKFAGIDPYVNFYFKLEINGLIVGHFQEVNGLTSTVEVVEHKEGGENHKVHKLLGQGKVGNITCKNGLTTSRQLWDWHRKCVTDRQNVRKNGYIMILGEFRIPLARWEFTRGWPCKWEGPSFDGKGNGLAIETVEIACEELNRIL